MRNRNDHLSVFFTLPQVYGTRAGEMSLYVIYDEPLKMLCDAPSAYEAEPDIPSFISQIPTTWDDTKVLDGVFGEFIIKARKTGNTWFIAGLNGEQSRTIQLDLSWLQNDAYVGEILRDGANAHRIGIDYVIEQINISKNSSPEITIPAGGGFIMRIEGK